MTDLVCTQCGTTAPYSYAARTDGEPICGQSYDDSGRANQDGEPHDWEEADE